MTWEELAEKDIKLNCEAIDDALKNLNKGVVNDRFNFRIWDTKCNVYFYDFYLNIVCGRFKACDSEDKGRYIIEQCTGLKDKNGKLIYEGDIIELTRSRNYGWCKRGRRLVVSWNTFNCCGFGFGAIGNLTKKCADNCIVIGNIHENPELLEGIKSDATYDQMYQIIEALK